MQLFDFFNKEFETELGKNDGRTHESIYEDILEKFEERHQFTPWPTFDAFRKKRERQIKKGTNVHTKNN